jgi:hypothetical protein
MGVSSSPENSDQNASSFVYYDRYVRQPRPWVITREKKETKVVCLAPDAVLERSRTPEGKWPPGSGSSETSEANKGRVGIMKVFLVGSTIVLMM